MPLIVGGAILGGSLLSGVLGSKAAGKQAEASSAGTREALAEQRRQFDIMQANAAPFQLAGNVALNQLMANLGLPSGSIQNYYGMQMGGRMPQQMGQFQRPMANAISGGRPMYPNFLARGASFNARSPYLMAQNQRMMSPQMAGPSNDLLRRISGIGMRFV